MQRARQGDELAGIGRHLAAPLRVRGDAEGTEHVMGVGGLGLDHASVKDDVAGLLDREVVPSM